MHADCGCGRVSARPSKWNPAPTIPSPSFSPSSWSRSCCSAGNPGPTSRSSCCAKRCSGRCIGYLGGHAIAFTLNRVNLPQGLQAPFVATAAIVVFGLCQSTHASGFLAVYLAGLIVGNRALRAHNAIVVFLDAVTWLAQIVMFVLFGLLAWPSRLPDQLLPALAVALTLMLIARPVAVFLCSRAIRLFVPRETVHFMGRPARCGRLLPGVDPAAGRLAEGAGLFRYRFRHRGGVAPHSGLDGAVRGAAIAHRQETPRHFPSACGTRSAGPAQSGACRLSDCRRAVRICGAGSRRPGPNSRWLCAARRC